MIGSHQHVFSLGLLRTEKEKLKTRGKEEAEEMGPPT